MPSQRNILKDNVNGSKNTRMDIDNIDNSMSLLDFRVDEFMFLARYNLGAQTIIDLGHKLKRPLKVLDLGCGQMNTVRFFYKSYPEKKSDYLSEYIGVDIDYVMVEDSKKRFGKCYDTCNADFIVQDLTVNPQLDRPDGYFDLIICTEFLEHINPEYSQAIIEECYRLLNPEGVALFSTPNSNGSNSKLPKDHFYEYSYEELMKKFVEASFIVEDTVGMSMSISKLPKEYIESLNPLLTRMGTAFGRNSAFMRVAIAPLITPAYCKNVLYICKK